MCLCLSVSACLYVCSWLRVLSVSVSVSVCLCLFVCAQLAQSPVCLSACACVCLAVCLCLCVCVQLAESPVCRQLGAAAPLRASLAAQVGAHFRQAQGAVRDAHLFPRAGAAEADRQHGRHLPRVHPAHAARRNRHEGLTGQY